MTSVHRSVGFRGLAAMASLSMVLIYGAASAQTSVTTYHNDNYRSGWNSTEKVLTVANVNASKFGLLATVTVDDQVDAQPLVVPGVNITAGSFQGTHTVLYIVTGNDTVYAIDASAGTVLLSNHLGSPVPKPLNCNNNGPNVGITSTPVIDTSTNTMYLIAYTSGTSGPVYTLHALSLSNLTDSVTPQVVSASHTLTNGTSYVFNAKVQRQRPSLLEANGNIYAGFGSFCDTAWTTSRGWLLGWNATTLAALPADQLIDTQASDPDTFFLSSIWMSGYGLAADDSGNVVFATANSDPSGTTYDGVTNIQESVIEMTPDLSTVVDLFTPSNWNKLDEHDLELGAGGVMILPDQPGFVPHLAVAAGKDGDMYFMNEDNLGGYSPTADDVIDTHFIGGCWCGESYFEHAGAGRVVSSGADTIKIFKVVTSTTANPSLSHLASSAAISTGQNGGFFTSISSNGNDNPIIWALSRPLSTTQPNMTLYAFNPNPKGGGVSVLFSAVAGQWPNWTGDSNQVPTIANGKVYVASDKQVNIFGLLPAATKK
jgi:hypothetical protein